MQYPLSYAIVLSLIDSERGQSAAGAAIPTRSCEYNTNKGDIVMFYRARLTNNSGTVFGHNNSRSISNIKSWARKRGGVYRLDIEVYWEEEDFIPIEFQSYRCYNNRLYHIETCECGKLD